jgi:uncharacterized membrane protein YphA (DoxX/SURF4 family)
LDRGGVPGEAGGHALSFLRSRAFRWLLGAILGAVFVYASVDKILHPAEFARIVYHYQIIGPSQRIPPLVPNAFALVLPWIELVTGLLLIAGIWRREAAGVAAALLAAFVGAVSVALARGIDLKNCGCFSVTSEGRAAGAALIAGDTVLLAIALYLAFARDATRATASEASSSSLRAEPAPRT